MFTKQSITILTALAKQSMINRLLNLINRNRSAPKISKVMSSNDKAKKMIICKVLQKIEF